MSFVHKLHAAELSKKTRICVGLDPRVPMFPESIQTKYEKLHGSTFKAAAAAITHFNKEVIDIVAPYVAAVKPQIAFYEQYGPDGMVAFQETITYARKMGLEIIVDAKRGDISSTAEAYANSLIGTTPVFGTPLPCYDVDCITVNPFLGKDSIMPFVEASDTYNKGLFILVKTSNPGSRDLQDLIVVDVQESVSNLLADMVSSLAAERVKDGYSNIGAVVGATFPHEAKELRSRMPHSVFLIPGYGTQGGKADTLSLFFNKDSLGAVVNSSRGVTYPDNAGRDYKKSIEKAVQLFRNDVNKALNL